MQSEGNRKCARSREIARTWYKMKQQSGGFCQLNGYPAVCFVIEGAHARFKVTLVRGPAWVSAELDRSYMCLKRERSRDISRTRYKIKQQIGGFSQLNGSPAVCFVIGRAHARLRVTLVRCTFSTFETHVHVMTSALLKSRDEWYWSHASCDGVCRAHHLVWTGTGCAAA